ncbi:MAG: hypothetical protein U0807_07510 [Candidatus Binatia bacterium]
MLVAARQTVEAAAKASVGHCALVPEHVSATSHVPVAARHVVVLGRKLSVGQVVLEPVQVSATSHAPAATRQTVPALPAGCWQVPTIPSQTSWVHALPSSSQDAPLARSVQVDVQQEAVVPFEVPVSHSSPASMVPSPHAACARTGAAKVAARASNSGARNLARMLVSRGVRHWSVVIPNLIRVSTLVKEDGRGEPPE